jgi:hypothetical protein
VKTVVDWMRELVIKAQGFIQYYVLKTFSEDNDILAGFFKPGCTNSVMQMVTRQAMTNTIDSNIPRGLAYISLSGTNIIAPIDQNSFLLKPIILPL